MSAAIVVNQPSLKIQPRRLARSSAPKQNWARKTMRILLAATAVGLVWTWHPSLKIPYERGPHNHGEEHPGHADDVLVDSWEGIEPSTSLKWTRCFRSEGPFLCSRLTVPMDYHRPLEESSDHPKVHLALLMIPGEGRGENDNVSPANFSISPLLINPGGPGGSGVDLAKRGGTLLQSIVGKERDIIGFDPRGVASSTPRANCFLQNTMGRRKPNEDEAYVRRMTFMAGAHDVGFVNSSAVALAKQDARQRLVNQLCKIKDEEEGENNIFRHVGTPNVARDMLSIVHAWDRWRDGNDDTDADAVSSMDQAETENPLDTRGKLVYWGFSYGTLLGATFAAMFPDEVGRIVLDGVVDADHYVRQIWDDSLVDADTIWDKFFVYCHKAGPKCAFSHPSYSVQDLRDRYEAIASHLKADPILVVSALDKFPFLITYTDLESLIFQSLYSPITLFPIVARVLVWMEQHVPGSLAYSGIAAQGLCIPKPVKYPEDSERGVMCGDKRYPLNDTVPELQKRFERIASYSRFAGLWMTIDLECSHYDIPISDPPMRWGTMPEEDEHEEKSIGQVLASLEEKKIKTRFPLLLATNTYDPVTPKAAALRMVQKFKGTRMLEQRAEGHSTISASSVCSMMVIRNYLGRGALPDEADVANGKWTVCDADNHPWGSSSSIPDSGDGVSGGLPVASDDEVDGALKSEMVENWAELRRRFPAGSWDGGKVYRQQELSRGMRVVLENLDNEM